MSFKGSKLEANFPIGKLFPHEGVKLAIEGDNVVFRTRYEVVHKCAAINKHCRPGKVSLCIAVSSRTDAEKRKRVQFIPNGSRVSRYQITSHVVE